MSEPRTVSVDTAQQIVDRLHELYPDAEAELHWESPFQLLVATILSAQSTDERVNRVTPELFGEYGSAAELAAAEREEVEELIRSTGFYRQKAKNIQGAAQRLVEEHGGEVPADMDALTDLPGVARKTANVVLGTAFGKAEGVVVDTHVRRLAFRLGLSSEEKPGKVERDLMELFPRAEWIFVADALIWHGRRVCHARQPRCDDCRLSDLCPQNGVAQERG